ncbi:MAG: sigma-70 family RNA polymerase sigma factor [Myxococcota bacterium]
MTPSHDDLRRIYGELRMVARALLRREPYAHTLESAELVHQAWARLLNGELRTLAESEPSQVIALAVTNMRRELCDHARRRRAQKRPTARARVELQDAPDLSHEHPETLLAIDQLLDELERGPDHVRNPERKASVARYALYGGLSESEIAEVLNLPKSTVGADARFARAWLAARLSDTEPAEPERDDP